MGRPEKNNKVPSTFSLDKDIKMHFKMACINSGVDMSDVLDSLMANYVKATNSVIEANKELIRQRIAENG